MKIKNSDWEKELKLFFAEQLAEGVLDTKTLLEWWPTRESWEDMDKWAQGYEIFTKDLSKKFKTVDELEDFEREILKDSNLLQKYLKKDKAELVVRFISEKTKRTTGAKKFFHFFEGLVKSPGFNKEVRKTRVRLDIPINGFKHTSQNIKLVKNKDYILWDEALELGKKFGLYDWGWSSILTKYLLFNLIDTPGGDFDFFHLCKIEDGGERKTNTLKSSNETEQEFDKDFTQDDWRKLIRREEEEDRLNTKWFPVVIRLNPYASLRDILDFVTKHDREIKRLQKIYRRKNKEEMKLWSLKRKNPKKQERNDFIYEHRDLPRKEIMRLVGDKFGYDEVIDYGLIGKIISLERKKRK